MTAPDFATRFGPVPQALRDLFFERARGTGSFALNLAVNGTIAPEVALFNATRSDAGNVRGTILRMDTQAVQFQLLGIDSDKEAVATWFRLNGVPVLSIGRLLT